MTNTPSMVAEGATVYAVGEHCDPSDGSLVKQLFTGVGSECHQVSESHINAVTGMSGSGPAYMYLIIGESLSFKIFLRLLQKKNMDNIK